MNSAGLRSIAERRAVQPGLVDLGENLAVDSHVGPPFLCKQTATEIVA